MVELEGLADILKGLFLAVQLTIEEGSVKIKIGVIFVVVEELIDSL